MYGAPGSGGPRWRQKDCYKSPVAEERDEKYIAFLSREHKITAWTNSSGEKIILRPS